MKYKGLLVAVAMALVVLNQAGPISIAASSGSPLEASSLVVSVTPPRLPSDGGTYPAIIVSLADKSGLPTIADSDITIFLTASPAGIVVVPNQVRIDAGKEYVVVNITTTTVPGTAAITASSAGLSSPAPSSLITLGPAGYPSKLVVFVSPTKYLDRNDAGIVRVELVDDAGLPSKAISPVKAALSSSNSNVTLDQNSVTVAEGDFFADGSFHTGAGPGNAVITATTTGFTSGAALLTVESASACNGFCIPNQISLRMVVPGTPGILPTDGRQYGVLEVSLTTADGQPAVFDTPTVVQLSSSKSEVASVPSLITIPAGKISFLANITTSSLAGNANITAVSGGLLPSTIEAKTIIPAPSKLQVYVSPPSSAYSTNGNQPVIVVQLQDSNGNPARARSDTSIMVTSSNGTLVHGVLPLSIPLKGDYAFSTIQVTSSGASVLTAISAGLSSSQANLQIVRSPVVVTITPGSSKGYLYTNQTEFFSYSATFLGRPLQNLNVTWSSTSGNVSPTSGSTGTSGVTSATFYPTDTGSVNITASASSPQTGPIVVSAPLQVYQTPARPPPSLVQVIIGFWYYIVAAVVAVVIALVYVLRLRRKKQRAEIEAGFEVV